MLVLVITAYVLLAVGEVCFSNISFL